MSRDLHDQVGQHMTALKMRLAALHSAAEGDAGRRHDIDAVLQLAEEVDRSLTHLTMELRPSGPLENFGLAAALENLVSRWSERFGIHAEFQGLDTDGLRLPLDVSSNLYVLVQEALHNIVKHARASHVAMLLQCHRDQIVLVVEDDGRGFDTKEALSPEDHGLGLTSMRERAFLCGGTLEIDAEPGHGTTIVVRLPNPHP